MDPGRLAVPRHGPLRPRLTPHHTYREPSTPPGARVPSTHRTLKTAPPAIRNPRVVPSPVHRDLTLNPHHRYP